MWKTKEIKFFYQNNFCIFYDRKKSFEWENFPILVIKIFIDCLLSVLFTFFYEHFFQHCREKFQVYLHSLSFSYFFGSSEIHHVIFNRIWRSETWGIKEKQEGTSYLWKVFSSLLLVLWAWRQRHVCSNSGGWWRDCEWCHKTFFEIDGIEIFRSFECFLGFKMTVLCVSISKFSGSLMCFSFKI